MFYLDINIFKDTMYCTLWVGTFGLPAENAAKQNKLDPKNGLKKHISDEITTKKARTFY